MQACIETQLPVMLRPCLRTSFVSEQQPFCPLDQRKWPFVQICTECGSHAWSQIYFSQFDRFIGQSHLKIDCSVGPDHNIAGNDGLALTKHII